MSARKAAEKLNADGVPTPAGGKWHATQVIRVRERLRVFQECLAAIQSDDLPAPAHSPCQLNNGVAKATANIESPIALL